MSTHWAPKKVITYCDIKIKHKQTANNVMISTKSSANNRCLPMYGDHMKTDHSMAYVTLLHLWYITFSIAWTQNLRRACLQLFGSMW